MTEWLYQTNLNLLPHEKSFVATNVRLAEIPFHSAIRFGEAVMPKIMGWFRKKPTVLNYARYNEEEMIRRATFDPMYFFQLFCHKGPVLSFTESDPFTPEQRDFLTEWIRSFSE